MSDTSQRTPTGSPAQDPPVSQGSAQTRRSPDHLAQHAISCR